VIRFREDAAVGVVGDRVLDGAGGVGDLPHRAEAIGQVPGDRVAAEDVAGNELIDLVAVNAPDRGAIVAVEIDPGVEVFHADEGRSVPGGVEMCLPAVKAAATHHGHSRVGGPEVWWAPKTAPTLRFCLRAAGTAVGGAFFYPDELIFVVVAV